MPEEYRVGPGKPPLEHRFRPGNPGGGRPRGTSLERAIKKLAKEGLTVTDSSGKERHVGLEDLARVAFLRASRGDFRFWTAILERLDGKVTQPIKLDGLLGLQSAQQDGAATPEEIEQERRQIMGRRNATEGERGDEDAAEP